ncbi:hypothetical protein GQ600_13743 [Phytophthora cactorum]|nr:hypothetical protein GQ600_13743 [Phytophthora cactorum]
MVSIRSSSSAGTVEAASFDTVLDSGSNGSQTHAGSGPTRTVSDTKTSESAALSTPLLVGIIAASVVVFVAVLLVIRGDFDDGIGTRLECPRSKLSVDVVASPRPPLMQTFKLSRLSAKELADDQVSLDIHDAPMNGLSSVRDTQTPRTTSLISVRSVFSASFLMRGGLRSSLPIEPVNRKEYNGYVCVDDILRTNCDDDNRFDWRWPIPLDQRQGDAWRDLSETCWSIDPGSDSETESERFMMPTASHSNAYTGALMLKRGRLSTLSDRTAEFEEEAAGKDPDVNSLDDSSRRRDLTMSALDDLSPRRERGISQFDDSSPRRIRGLSTLDSRKKANSVAETDTNNSNWSYFSTDSDYMYYGETIKDCSSIFFYDSDSDCLSSSSSDSDDCLREEEF